ncbi:MAG: hypothetical protein ABIS35_13060 [Terracoccus sp.]
MSTDPSPHASPSGTPTVPERLLQLLDRLGAVLAARGDAIALLGLGSVGRDLHRLDEHSDADFFVVVDEGAETAYLGDIDWLEATAPVAWSFVNSPHGRKALFEDGLFAEYAVFTLTELAGASYPPARAIWCRGDAPVGLEEPAVPLPVAPSLEEQVGEAVTNLYVGLHRDLRGERLTATRFIQGYAVDRVVTVLGLLGLGDGGQQDPFVVERGVERRFPASVLPLGDLVLGYEGNGRAALALLDVLERHVAVHPAMASAVRELGARSVAAAEQRASAGQSSSRT